jgi:hypothetical protein
MDNKMHPEKCPQCDGDDIDTPDTAELIEVSGQPQLIQWTVCNDESCQAQWNARYAFVENYNVRVSS